MREPRGHTCPECGAPRGADNTPSCDCTQRASEALREARTAEAAAAEDFDPLRIRPYVEVPGPSDAPAEEETRPIPAAEVTLPLHPVPGPNGQDLRLFEGEPPHEPTAGAEPLKEPRRRSRRTLLLSVAGAGVAVLASAGLASGLFSYHTPSRDPAAQEVRESVPEATTPSTSSAPTSPASTRPAAQPPSPSTDPSPSPSASSASPTPTVSPSASRSASPTPSATATGTPNAAPTTAPVLRRGDKGAAVIELQLRLEQLNLYGDEVNGVFTTPVEDAVRNYQWARGISDDTLGVYGPATRTSLESETSKPPSAPPTD
ncbi:peptidoglycan-binding protein [Streptomyces cellostaticus]|uniref:Peptidoglycan-binding protein n=1 Tax=Streptomyces cellostaticus TaxID=67285 RepID=A0A101NR02_9ACTN|nr:peptidoglycan-binding domain-containing protein [Streptomyces cellostaticus]KUM97634.1 peptidoglycan-binding protein [Streptomyces cellostaticus]